MDHQIFDTLQAAMAGLNWDQEQTSLAQMRQVYEQQLYFVAFIGQYSAGKSCLINNLLNREILPEGITETTPLLTYIRYGEREQARLHYLDGAVQVLFVDQVSELIQSHNGDKWDLNALDYLEIYLQEEALRQGMVLLDTPGINTLIERHEQLLAVSLAMAAKIIYVAGRAPTKVDVDKLAQLTAQGFDISFVRTHCDEIRASEESDREVMAADQKLLALCGVDAGNCFHLSNRPESRWFAAIDPLCQMLAEKGERAGQELEQASSQQLSVLAQRCREALVEKQRFLSEAHTSNTEALEERRATLENQMQSLRSEMERRQKQLQSKVAECQRVLNGCAAQEAETLLDVSAQRIQSCGSNVSTAEQMRTLMQQEAGRLARQVYQMLNAYIDPLVEEINGDFQVEGIALGNIALPQAEHYGEMREEQDLELEHLREKLQAVKADCAAMELALQTLEGSPEYMQLYQELQAIEEDLVEAQSEHDGLAPYVPQLIELEDNRPQPSDIARTIGNLADLVLFVLPGNVVGTAAKSLAGSTKLTRYLAKLIGGADKVGKIFKHGDSIKDIVYGLQNMSKTYATAKRKAQAAKMLSNAAKGATAVAEVIQTQAQGNPQLASFLDYLTLQYWGEQIGKKFDRPPKMVIDQEYERQYREKKQELEQKLREKQQLAYRNKLKLNTFKNEAARLKAEQDSLIVNEQEIEAALHKQEERIRQAAEKKALENWKAQCAAWYREQLDKQIKEALQGYLTELPGRLSNYQDRRMQTVMARLEQQQAAYDEITCSAPDETAAALETVNRLLEQVEEYV